MAEDEERHALLAFRIVAWALATGGDDVKAAAWAALEDARLPRSAMTADETAARSRTVDTIARECLERQLTQTSMASYAVALS